MTGLLNSASLFETNLVALERLREYDEVETEVGVKFKFFCSVPECLCRDLALFRIDDRPEIGLTEEKSNFDRIPLGIAKDSRSY